MLYENQLRYEYVLSNELTCYYSIKQADVK